MTNELVPYDTSYLSGFVVEHYQVVLLDAAKASEDAMVQKLRELCAAQIPGDTYRNLVIHPTFSARTFKHILVPVWLLTYTYGADGLSGAGQRPYRADGRPVSEEPLEGGLPRHRDYHRRVDPSLTLGNNQ